MRTCTSLDGVHKETVDGAVRLRQKCAACALTVTQGTEAGQPAGTYSHGNGWKLDFAKNDCLTDCIKTRTQAVGPHAFCDKWGYK